MIPWKKGLRYQDKKKTKRARQLRKSMTDAERKIWRLLRSRRFTGVKFRRQVPFGPYIIDFYSPEKKIAVELDGSQHFNSEGIKKDAKRDEFLSSHGIKVIRYSDREALKNSESLMQHLYEIMREQESSPQSSPFSARGGSAFGGQGEEVRKRESPPLLNKERVRVRTSSPFQGEGNPEREDILSAQNPRYSASTLSQKGIVLIVAILALLVAAIFLPALIFVVSNETKWSVKQKKTSIAFQMAEAGLDQGVWKLQESDSFFSIASTGGIIGAGYNFDKVYVATATDGTLGEYKIKIGSSSVRGTNDAVTVRIEARGRDKSTEEVRTLEAIYERKLPANNALTAAGGVKYENTFVIHWGPALSYTNIELQGTQRSNYWPKKISKGKIVPWDTNPNPPNEEITNFPPDRNFEAYKTDLGDPPRIDLDTYRDLAKKSRIPKPNGSSRTWKETEGRKRSDKINENDWKIDFNGNGTTNDQIQMDEIEAACGPSSGTITGFGAPTASTQRSTCTHPNWVPYLSLYRDLSVCPTLPCAPNAQAYYLDINGNWNGNGFFKNYSDRCARPQGIVGDGDNGGQSSSWQGTGYFNGTNEVIFEDYWLDCSTCVIFIEGDPSRPTKNIFKFEDQDCSRTFLRVEAFVTALGDGHVHNKGRTNYQVKVPTGAWKQYVAGTVSDGDSPDTSAKNEYPADNGLHTSSDTWVLPDSRFDRDARGVAFHGFLSPYTFSCGGGKNIVVGSIYGRKEGSREVDLNTFIIYYDSATATNIRYSEPGIQRVSWREIKTDW